MLQLVLVVTGGLFAASVFLGGLAGYVGAVWLLIRGAWGTVALGVGAAVLMPRIYTFVVFVPLILLSRVVGISSSPYGFRPIDWVAFFISRIFDFGSVLVWAFFVYWFFCGRFDGQIDWPSAMFSYGVVFTPLDFMERHELSPGSEVQSAREANALWTGQLARLMFLIMLVLDHFECSWLTALIPAGFLIAANIAGSILSSRAYPSR